MSSPPTRIRGTGRLPAVLKIGTISASVALACALGLSAEPPTAAEEPVLGAATSWDSAALAEPLVALPAGTGLRLEPDLALSAVVILEAQTELPLLERKGPWARVRHGSLRGWALLGADNSPGTEEAARRRARTVDPDTNILAAARAAFERSPTARPFGGFVLFTDVSETGPLADLEAIAGHLETAYRERLGVALSEGPRQAIVLFRRDEDYTRYVAGDPLLRDSESSGHAGNGIAVLAAGARDRAALRALFVHEVVHLLNRRALGTDLPAWIDEGLADDLGSCRISAAGRLVLGTFAGRAHTMSGPASTPTDPLSGAKWVATTGPIVLMTRLVGAWDDPRRARLSELVSLPSATLSDPELCSILYPLSTAFVRFLLDGSDRRRREGFLQVLAELATGERPDAGGLAARLGGPLDELEPLLLAWLRRSVELNAHSLER